MKNVVLVRASKDWKDKAAGWHMWRGDNTCPVCGVEFTDTLSGTRAAAERFLCECPACDELEEPQDWNDGEPIEYVC